MHIQGPVRPMLARSLDRIPEPAACRGGCRYEPKWDGFRAVVMVDEDGAVHLTSRNLTRLNDAFPELPPALLERLAPGTVVDGEIVRWSGEGRLDFGALQRRHSGGRRIWDLALAEPCHYVVFDVLESRGTDLRGRPLHERRHVLECLLGHVPETSFVVLTPHTADVAEARLWFDTLTGQGFEGVVVKAADDPYVPGRRGWWKVKHRTVTTAIVGGLTGSLQHPADLILGRHEPGTGTLRIVGRTSAVPATAHAELDAALSAAGEEHPWPEQLPPSWLFGGSRTPTPYIRVRPDTVVEVSVDVAVERGRWRHPARYLRIRRDLDPSRVPPGPEPDH